MLPEAALSLPPFTPTPSFTHAKAFVWQRVAQVCCPGPDTPQTVCTNTGRGADKDSNPLLSPASTAGREVGFEAHSIGSPNDGWGR